MTVLTHGSGPAARGRRRGESGPRGAGERRAERWAGAWEQAREEGKRAALEKGKRRRVGPLAGLPGLRWAAVGWFG